MGFTPWLVDVHNHSILIHPDAGRKEYAEAFRQGIGIITTSLDVLTAEELLDEPLPQSVTFALGIYPPSSLQRDVTAGYLKDMNASISRLREIIQQTGERVVGIGEIGLDGIEHPTEEDIHVFREQIRLAREISLPIIVHSRKAEQTIISILREEAGSLPVVLHSYTGKQRLAHEALDTLNVSFSIPCSIQRSRHFQELVQMIPPERLLLETDAPFLPARRGEPSSSLCLPESLRMLSSLLSLPEERLRMILLENTLRVFPRLRAWYSLKE